MIDFHNHILPDIDDGSKSLEISLDMLRHAESQGITEVINTVHYQHPKVEGKDISFSRVKKELDLLQEELIKSNIKIKLHCGAEVFFLPNLMQIKNDPLSTFGHGKYMLIEFQFHELPEIQRQHIFDLKMVGVTPIIAHPERYRPVQGNHLIIEDWLNAGCLIQVDAGSVLGKFGPNAKQCAEKIIQNNWCHILGSDSHDNKRRNFCLSEAIDRLRKFTTGEFINKMVNDNPRAVVEGNPIIIDFEYETIKKTSIFSIFKNRQRNN